MHRQLVVVVVMAILALIGSGCRSYASEQGTVQVETEYGKIVAVHAPGDDFSCISWWCDEYPVDLRDHMDGVDCNGVTSDNIPFYMKVDVVTRPFENTVAEYVGLFGAELEIRNAKRWAVLKQHVGNACRNATSGKYNAYDLRAKQNEVLGAIYNELVPKLKDEMKLHLSSVGMEIQPQFGDPRIDEAANAVVAAQKQKQAEEALKAAADIKATRQQVEAQIYANPNAMKIEELKLMLEIEKVRSDGIARHQGTLILGDRNTTPQLQLGGNK